MSRDRLKWTGSLPILLLVLHQVTTNPVPDPKPLPEAKAFPEPKASPFGTLMASAAGSVSGVAAGAGTASLPGALSGAVIPAISGGLATAGSNLAAVGTGVASAGAGLGLAAVSGLIGVAGVVGLISLYGLDSDDFYTILDYFDSEDTIEIPDSPPVLVNANSGYSEDQPAFSYTPGHRPGYPGGAYGLVYGSNAGANEYSTQVSTHSGFGSDTSYETIFVPLPDDKEAIETHDFSTGFYKYPSSKYPKLNNNHQQIPVPQPHTINQGAALYNSQIQVHDDFGVGSNLHTVNDGIQLYNSGNLHTTGEAALLADNPELAPVQFGAYEYLGAQDNFENYGPQSYLTAEPKKEQGIQSRKDQTKDESYEYIYVDLPKNLQQEAENVFTIEKASQKNIRKSNRKLPTEKSKLRKRNYLLRLLRNLRKAQ